MGNNRYAKELAQFERVMNGIGGNSTDKASIYMVGFLQRSMLGKSSFCSDLGGSLAQAVGMEEYLNGLYKKMHELNVDIKCLEEKVSTFLEL